MLTKEFKNYTELVAYVLNTASYRKVMPKQQAIYIGYAPVNSELRYSNIRVKVTKENEIVVWTPYKFLSVVELQRCGDLAFTADDTPVTLESIAEHTVDGVMEWVQATLKPVKKAVWALYIPQGYGFRCKTPDGVSCIECPQTAWGSVILCPDANGKADINRARIVEVPYFVYAYENKGWVQQLSEQVDRRHSFCVKPLDTISDMIYYSRCIDDNYAVKYTKALSTELADKNRRLVDLFTDNYKSDMTLQLFMERLKALQIRKLPAFSMFPPRHRIYADTKLSVMTWLYHAWVQEHAEQVYNATKQLRYKGSTDNWGYHTHLIPLPQGVTNRQISRLQNFYVERADFGYLWLCDVKWQQGASGIVDRVSCLDVGLSLANKNGKPFEVMCPLSDELLSPIMKEFDKVATIQDFIKTGNISSLRKVRKVAMPKDFEFSKRLDAMLSEFFAYDNQLGYNCIVTTLTMLSKRCIKRLRACEFKVNNVTTYKTKHIAGAVTPAEIHFDVITDKEKVKVKLMAQYNGDMDDISVQVSVGTDSMTFSRGDINDTLKDVITRKPTTTNDISYRLATYLCNLCEGYSVWQPFGNFKTYTGHFAMLNPMYGLQLESARGSFSFITETSISPDKIPLKVIYQRGVAPQDRSVWWTDGGDILHISGIHKIDSSYIALESDWAMPACMTVTYLDNVLALVHKTLWLYKDKGEYALSCLLSSEFFRAYTLREKVNPADKGVVLKTFKVEPVKE